jgi:hypothetical protein
MPVDTVGRTQAGAGWDGAGLSPRVPGFDRMQGSMGFFVDKVHCPLLVFWVSTVILV